MTHTFADSGALHYAIERWQMTAQSSTPNPRDLLNAGNDLAVMSNGLIYEYSEVLESLRTVDDALQSANERCEHLSEELEACIGTDVPGLAQLVRWEHDRTHRDPWPICGHEICRAAGRWVG